ncbi:hypothetical protein [Novosphingopyxis iocasae]|uniref:hypothetical protein n=1 Tax=Novosphingopyxis iocasae TaxID=2762729 RepID=UPI001651794C|nr:hypothetical protein [Novosphingopyxis iocasae]
MEPALAMPVAVLLACFGVLLLRSAWRRRQGARVPRTAMVASGWCALALGSILAAIGAGAWGVAVAATAAMMTAMALLGFAAWSAPAGPDKERQRRAQVAPTKPHRVGGRITTFLLVAVGAFAGAVAIALALRFLVLSAGWSEADANVTMLFVQPLAWAVLATALLVTPSRKRQLGIIAFCAVPALPALL